MANKQTTGWCSTCNAQRLFMAPKPWGRKRLPYRCSTCGMPLETRAAAAGWGRVTTDRPL
jgi:hypothetical protein